MPDTGNATYRRSTEEAAREAEAAEEAARERAERARERTAMVASLREFAQALEDNESMAVPYGLFASCYVANANEARASRRGLHGWTKHNTPESYYVSFARTFGDADSSYNVQYTVQYSKGDTCTRIQIGTEHVEATEARERPVYRWDCGGTEDDEVAE